LFPEFADWNKVYENDWQNAVNNVNFVNKYCSRKRLNDAKRFIVELLFSCKMMSFLFVTVSAIFRQRKPFSMPTPE